MVIFVLKINIVMNIYTSRLLKMYGNVGESGDGHWAILVKYKNAPGGNRMAW
jgi:hypothetical protein